MKEYLIISNNNFFKTKANDEHEAIEKFGKSFQFDDIFLEWVYGIGIDDFRCWLTMKGYYQDDETYEISVIEFTPEEKDKNVSKFFKGNKEFIELFNKLVYEINILQNFDIPHDFFTEEMLFYIWMNEPKGYGASHFKNYIEDEYAEVVICLDDIEQF